MAEAGQGRGSGNPETPPDALPRAALREATLAGVRWVALARGAAETTTLASAVILAHLVPPAGFGHAAVALVVTAFAVILTGESFGTPLVQRKQVERSHLESTVLLSLGFGALVSLSIFLAAPVLATPLFGEQTADLMQLISPVFLVAALGVVPHALLQRRLDFRRISIAEVLSLAMGASCAVALAVAGFDAEAIVLGSLIQATTFAVVLFLSVTPTRPRWHTREARETVSFGLPAALANFVNQTNRNVDYAILGARMSPTLVGFYWRAFQLGVEYQRKASGIMMRLALPVYSRATGQADMRALRAKIVRVHAGVIFPALATFIVIAPVLIPFAFGQRWEPTVVPAQILAVSGMAAAIGSGSGPLILASGRPRALLAFSIPFLLVWATGVYLAAPHGLVAVCWTAVGVQIVRVYFLHLCLLRPIVGLPMRQLWHDIAPAGCSSLALLGTASAVSFALGAAGLPDGVAAGAAAGLGLAVYVLTLSRLFPAAWADLKLLATRVLPSRARLTALSGRSPTRTWHAAAAKGFVRMATRR